MLKRNKKSIEIKPGIKAIDGTERDSIRPMSLKYSYKNDLNSSGFKL
jgi:hypothetical protein